MKKLKVGDKSPVFTANNQNGEIVNLESLRGNKVVLYFYPKDNTPGCTDEACNLRDNHSDLISAGYKVIGVSPDSEKTHKKFAEKHILPFDLLVDPDKKILNDFGVWTEKKMYGKVYMGVQRTTFIIDENGVIEKIIDKVDTKNHSSQIL